jgi:hypothetical protein
VLLAIILLYYVFDLLAGPQNDGGFNNDVGLKHRFIQTIITLDASLPP